MDPTRKVSTLEAKMAVRVSILLLLVLVAQYCVFAAEQCAMDPTRIDAVLQPLHGQLEALQEQLNVAKQLLTCCGAEQDVRICTTELEGRMGVEDGRIPDSSLTASSTWNNRHSHGPQRARLNTKGSIGSWCAGAKDPNPWIQVDFQKKVHMTGVITQGRNDKNQWVREYQVAFSQDGKTWTKVADTEGAPITFTGNTDRNTEVTNRFPATVTARYLRIYPTAFRGYRSMRFEVIGCTTPAPRKRLLDSFLGRDYELDFFH